MPKPRMLFLDDRSKRIHAALSHFVGYDVTIVTNVIEALRYLSSDDFELVRLDHDLNGCDFEDPDSPTSGMEVVRYLTKTGWPEGKKKPAFIVHSKNLFAAHLMIRGLKAIGLDAHYMPFEYEKKDNMKYDEKGNPIR